MEEALDLSSDRLLNKIRWSNQLLAPNYSSPFPSLYKTSLAVSKYIDTVLLITPLPITCFFKLTQHGTFIWIKRSVEAVSLLSNCTDRTFTTSIYR